MAYGNGLTRAQLINITGLADDIAGDVLKVCEQYLTGGETADSPYRIYHQSLREFLLTDKEYDVYPGERHAAIAGYLQEQYKSSWGNCNR